VTTDATLAEMERLIRRDPARRGLISSESTWGPLCPGHLAHAARHLSEQGRRAIIVTGFFIPAASPPSAETDGPPGAALLAAALMRAGLSVQIVTDEPCRQAVEVAAREMGLSQEVRLSTIPAAHDEQEAWCAEMLEETGHRQPLTHLISLERVGPSHTRASVRSQLRAEGVSDSHRLADFEQLVPEADRNHCHNMRGECIDAHTAPLHRLFELAANRGSIRTIGIGDGGNEIGMGSIPWHELHRRLSGPGAARVPCRIATDWTIVAGVSNWGGQALAAATLLLANKVDAARSWTTDQQHQALERLVTEGPAVDGITRLQQPTVDGLPFLTYIQPWEGLRRLMGFAN
jgi:D-glutamate cyclase